MHYFVVVLTTLIPSYVCLAVGVYALSFNARTLEQKIFFVYNFVVAFLSYADYEYRTAGALLEAIYWNRAHFIWPLIVVLPFHFSLLLSKKHFPIAARWIALLYLSALLVALVHFSPHIYQSDPDYRTYGWHSVYINNYATLILMMWVVVIGFVAVAIPFYAYKREEKYLLQKQFKYVTVAYAIGYGLGTLTGFLIPAFGLDVPEFGKFVIMLSNVVIVVAMRKFGIFEYTAKSVAESVLRTMPAAVFVTDVRGKVQLVNKAGLNFLRRIESDIVGRDISIFFAGPEYSNSDTDDFLKPVGTGLVPVYKTSNVIYDQHGVFQGMLVIATDISDVKKAEANLLIAKDKAEESDRLKSVFLANISHEIRTPMNAILGFAQLVGVGDGVDEKKKKYLDLIRKNVNNLLHIIDDLIEISKLESSKTLVKRNQFSVTDLFGQLTVLFGSLVSENNKRGVELIVRTVDKATDKIVSDKAIILKIMGKLLENSVKFTEKGAVELGYHSMEDAMALFYIKDSGVGIPKDKCKVIFEPFRQSEDTFARKFGGTGVSLTIAKRYVELLGGKIWVESENEQGAVFYFSVPIWGK